MSIEQIMAKSNCVVWRNIQLPHPSKSCKSPIFCFEGLNWHFNVSCCWTRGEEEWKFNTEHPNGAAFYSITPYVETSPGIYARTEMNLLRSILSTIHGINTDIITILFFFQPQSLSAPLDFNKATEVNASEKETIPSLCLEGLSKDIGQVFNDNEYSDATLKCGDKSFTVHRSILVARSEGFSAMFKHDMLEKNNGVVDIVDLDPNIVEQFLRYLYSGCVEEMSMDTVFELYKAADKYAVLTLKKLCASYIFDNMSENIISKVLLLADEAGDAELLNRVASFAAKTEGFLKSAEWKDFAEKYPSIAIKVFFKYLN